MRNESSKQRGDKHHASNLSLIILDEHKNPHSNLYYNLIHGIAVPGGKLHQWSTKLQVFLTNELNSLNPNSANSLYGGWGAPLMGIAGSVGQAQNEHLLKYQRHK